MVRSTPVIPPSRIRGGGPPRRRWDGLSWWWSLLVLAGILAWGAVIVFDIGETSPGLSDPPNEMTMTVTDVVSGAPVSGAEIRSNNAVYRTDDFGRTVFPYPVETSVIQVLHADYFPVYGETNAELSPNQSVALTPK